MAVVIRLRQEGAHGHHVFRVVAADKRFKRDGRFLEILGSYNPKAVKDKANIDLARVDAWFAGTRPSKARTVPSALLRCRRLRIQPAAFLISPHNHLYRHGCPRSPARVPRLHRRQPH